MSTFSQFHAQLDQTIIGYAALRTDTSYIMFDASIVLCESVEAMKAWVEKYHPAGLQKGMTFEPEVYAALTRHQHEEPSPFLLDTGSLNKFYEVESQDQRFHPFLTETTTEVGTLVEPEFDFFEDPIGVLQAQVDQFIVGYAILNTDNQLVQDADGCEILIGRKSEADERAKDAHARILLLTEKLLFRHEDEGYLFSADEVVIGRRRDLAQMQGHCDYIAQTERDE